jgi:hypothetical protein
MDEFYCINRNRSGQYTVMSTFYVTIENEPEIEWKLEKPHVYKII